MKMTTKNNIKSDTCPTGKTWVSPCNRTTTNKIGEKHTNPVKGFCRANRPKKIYLTYKEIELISKNFSKLTGPPSSNSLGFDDGNKYDVLIRGWVQYWNAIFNLKEPLDADLVKALIGSESSFHWYEENDGARGLMQITDSTRANMNDPKELRNYLIKLNKKEIMDPNLSICAGVRWLFRKKQIAESKHRMSWREAIREYKGYHDNEPQNGMSRIDELYKKIKERP